MTVTTPALASQEAGHFQFVHGQVQVERDNRTLNAERGMVVQVGDKLITAVASSAQLRMVDGAMLALRPRSELLIEGYRYDGSDQDAALVNLARGGLRSVTGAIGRARPDNVKIDTPVATMGIRGTDMDTFVPPASAQQEPTAVLRVNSGRGTITAQGVTLEVPTGGIAQAIRGQIPRIIPALPAEAEAQDSEVTQSTDEDTSTDEAINDDQQQDTNLLEEPEINLVDIEESRPSIEALNLQEVSDGQRRVLTTPPQTVIPGTPQEPSRIIITIQ
ncbi:MAG: FecR domain-containing protein [Marinospirillum sp.]|uniref:FecR family protein n=1 Tax=Marinospirillum sp. TaxID=2183934 RepID=UPI0019ECF845|nr:FecR domain-containing protein [Marinospirillum sp.]MBE0508209.1 FecR domain-containing protein [Marinospirillum sp.]